MYSIHNAALIAAAVATASALVTPGASRVGRIYPGPDVALADYNFAGVALQATSTEGYTSVSATFTIPKATTPPGGQSGTNYDAAVWAGM